MEFFYLLVFGFVDGSLCRDLVVEESNVGLVLGRHDLLFGLNFMEGLMKVLDLLVVHLLPGLDSIHKLLDSRLSLFKAINVVSLDSFEFFMFRLEDFILFDNKNLKLLSLCLHGVNYALESIFHLRYVICMDFCQSLLHSVQLQLNLSLDLVNLFF